jgi:anti-sigma regulatory factor (Ser/Thr protein kinase)
MVALPRSTEAPGRARSAVNDLAPELAPMARDKAHLVVTELVTNALTHGRGAISLSLGLRRDGRLRGQVVDEGDGFEPPSVRPNAGELGGWGLWLVDELAQSWGIRTGTTTVWFQLPA